MTIDWKEAALQLKREVRAHGGFLTLQRDALRERFGIGRLTEKNSAELKQTLLQEDLFAFPHPYAQVSSLRVYDVETDVGKIALTVLKPDHVPESALNDVVSLYARAEAGKNRRSDDVPWLTAFDVFLQVVIGRPPEGWEDLDDDRELIELAAGLASSLELPDGVVESRETRRIAGAVCACRPHAVRWQGATTDLGNALAEAARKQKEVFDRVLREAAMELLCSREIPARDVELGRLGLRYRREGQGGIGWLR